MKPADQRRSLEARAVTRRHVMHLLLAGVAGAIGTGVAFALLSDRGLPARQQHAPAPAAPPSKSAVKLISPHSDRELLGADLHARTHRLIERVERGFARFEPVLRSRIQRISEAWLRTQLELPFRYVAGNHKNPQRNYETVRHLDNGGIEDLRTLQDETYFFYSLITPSDALVAAYAPAPRLMQLREDIDPDNDLDMLVFFHELCHVAYDTLRRSGLRTDTERHAYLEFNRSLMTNPRTPRLDLLSEATAYALEIEALNLLLDGELEASVREHRALDVEAVLRRLHARPDQREKLMLEVEFASRFYPQRWTANGNPPQSLQDDVAAQYAVVGYEIYLPSPEGMRLVRSPAIRSIPAQPPPP